MVSEGRLKVKPHVGLNPKSQHSDLARGNEESLTCLRMNATEQGNQENGVSESPGSVRRKAKKENEGHFDMPSTPWGKETQEQ